MSLGIVIKAPEGIVLAAESRVTLTAKNQKSETIHVNFDNANKILTFASHPQIGVVTYGAAAIGIRTAYSFVPEFETELNSGGRLKVADFAKKLSEFFMRQWTTANMPQAKDYLGQNMTFLVAGYDEHEPYGTMYQFDIPRNPEPRVQYPGKDAFGISWGGQREIVDRLIMGYDSKIFQSLINAGIIKDADIPTIKKVLAPLQLAVPIQFMPLQDCINFARLIINTTITTQELTVGLRGCGGEIDVSIITRDTPLTFIHKKKLTAE